jgi:hypothetical protein
MSGTRLLTAVVHSPRLLRRISDALFSAGITLVAPDGVRIAGSLRASPVRVSVSAAEPLRPPPSIDVGRRIEITAAHNPVESLTGTPALSARAPRRFVH